MQAFTTDDALHIVSILAFLGGTGITYTKTIRFISKWESIHDQNPPHRHVNGHILYPRGMEPGKVGEIDYLKRGKAQE